MCDLTGMRFNNMPLIDYMCSKNEYSAIAVTPDCKRWGVATSRKTQEKANADAIDWCDGKGLGTVGNYRGCRVQYKGSDCGIYLIAIILLFLIQNVLTFEQLILFYLIIS